MRLRCVRVLADRTDFVLEADTGGSDAGMVDGRAVDAIMERLPGLAAHRCSAGRERSFADEIGHTEPPHLFEHVVLEIMALAGSPRSVRGETVWRKGGDAFCVSIFDDDDAVCLGAGRLAMRMIEEASASGRASDPGGEIRRLASLRAMPNRHGAEIDPSRDAVLRYPATPGDGGAHDVDVREEGVIGPATPP